MLLRVHNHLASQMKNVVTMNAATMDVAKDATAVHLAQATAAHLVLAVQMEALVQAEAAVAADARMALRTMEANAYVIPPQNVVPSLATTRKRANAVLLCMIGTGPNALVGSRMNFAIKPAQSVQKQTLQNVLANVLTEKNHVRRLGI